MQNAQFKPNCTFLKTNPTAKWSGLQAIILLFHIINKINIHTKKTTQISLADNLLAVLLNTDVRGAEPGRVFILLSPQN